jgi:hypothetical protein
MKATILLFFILFLPVTAFSVNIEDDPYELFNMSKRMYDNAEIEIHTDNNISERCEQESHKRGYNGFPYKVYACTFWDEGGRHKCSIYLPKQTNMHQLGHEMRHCFQGVWHE